ncbi:hypothetical protein JXB12_11675 [candidate division KSB1 bacterium]|nr:hypothetical protein [candidate division KSB1 bacterium]
MKQLLRITLIALCTASVTLTAAAQSNDGVFTGAFLRMGVGARAMSLGGAFTAIADGPEASFYNPGGMPFLEKHHFMASYRILSLDRTYGFLGYAQSIRPKVDPDSDEQPFNAGLAINWIYAGVDHIDGRGLNGQSIGEFSNDENAFTMSFGISPAKFLGIGITGKVLYNRFPKLKVDDSAITDKSFGMDFGILIKPSDYITLGFQIKDINAKYDWKTDEVWDKDIDKIDHFPRTYRGGVALRWPAKNVLLAFDYADNDQLEGQYHLGIEALPIDKVSLRMGLNNGNFSAGAGYLFSLFGKASKIEYALVTRDYDISSEHVMSWYFIF